MAIGMANISLTAILLPAQINSLVSSNQTGIYSLIVGLGAVAAVLTNPVAGLFSDRTTSRLGRRRPWLISGGVLTVIVALLLSIAPSLAVVAVEWVFLQVAINIIQAAVSSIVPDQIPVAQRANASALTNGVGVMLGGLIGDILIAQAFKTIQGGYTAIAIGVIITLALFFLVLRDVRLPKEHIPAFSAQKALSALKPLAERDFLLVWPAA
jgi:MFS family permease